MESCFLSDMPSHLARGINTYMMTSIGSRGVHDISGVSVLAMISPEIS